MPRPYYFFSSGQLRRRGNTLVLELSEESGGFKKTIPVEDVESLWVFGELTLNTKLLVFLSQNRIPVHFFNYYEFYSGSFCPREYLHSGATLVAQVRHYLDPELRLYLAREFVDAGTFNILKNLQYYENRGKTVTEAIGNVEAVRAQLGKAETVPELMALEGQIRELYYSAWSAIVGEAFGLDKRTRRPPENPINALVSFANSLTYSAVLGEIYHTQLHPTVSFLHEPGERRFSLSLDLAEIFKPVLADRLIFRALNERIVQDKHFDQRTKGCFLNDDGRKKFVQMWDERLRTTIKHRKLRRKVSYKQLIRLECYKLVKHILGDERYKGFHIWW
ncbi:MAG TPA: type I-B CRISPR-associated endonuclease Cas1 [Bacteroidetes bacterium]|nr:type I-B CRISPR-associated endonuclease Cas1 [Bacteroidota bacterium]